MNTTRCNNSGTEDSSQSTVRLLLQQIVEMCELQVRLLYVDIRSGSKHLQFGVLALLAAAVGLIAILPVFLIAVADVLAARTRLSEPVSQLIVCGAALVIGCILAGRGWFALQAAASKLERSRQEFEKNMEWFQNILADDHAQRPASAACKKNNHQYTVADPASVQR